MIRPGLDSDTDSTVFTTGHGLVTWRGFINVLREGMKRNICPTGNKETIIIIMEDQKGKQGSLLACCGHDGFQGCFQDGYNW